MSFKDARKERGLCLAEVVRRTRVSPHMMRVTFTGENLDRWPQHGFDQWFRLFLPQDGGEADFSRVPERFSTAGYMKFLRTPADVRPVIRNYTVRAFRPEVAELDVDFVLHGDTGVAGRWSQQAEPGQRVAIVDQGRGFDPRPDTSVHLLAGDETALPAILGILRDLPREARGLAIIEVPELADAQPVEAPEAVEVRWLPRDGGDEHLEPGALALEAVRTFVPEDPATVLAYVAGEQMLATGGRRHLVKVGVPKPRIAFIGHWRAEPHGGSPLSTTATADTDGVQAGAAA